MVDALRATGQEFGSFDIFSDEDVREGLKVRVCRVCVRCGAEGLRVSACDPPTPCRPAAAQEYSNWPTYPQLYVNGELVGGCDIVLEMAESGELAGEVAKARGAKDAVRQRVEGLVKQQSVMLFMKVGGEVDGWVGAWVDWWEGEEEEWQRWGSNLRGPPAHPRAHRARPTRRAVGLAARWWTRCARRARRLARLTSWRTRPFGRGSRCVCACK